MRSVFDNKSSAVSTLGSNAFPLAIDWPTQSTASAVAAVEAARRVRWRKTRPSRSFGAPRPPSAWALSRALAPSQGRLRGCNGAAVVAFDQPRRDDTTRRRR